MTWACTEPALRGRNTAIARAAAFSGFDPIKIETLLSLVNAVREADRAIYPDFYTGTGQRSSDVQQAYAEAVRGKPFPFAVTPDIKSRRSGGDCSKESVHSNRVMKRRNREDFPDSGSLAKKFKAETPPLIDLSEDNAVMLTNDPTIDVTGGDDQQSHLLPFRPRLQEALQPRRLHSPATAHSEPQTVIQPQTQLQFHKVLSRLRYIESNLKKNRTVLRKQWDADPNLQRQTVTDELGTLNECFERAETATQEAIALVQNHFLPLPE